MSRVLAVDPGAVRVGLALSDEGRSLATPLATLPATAALPREIAARARQAGAELILVGLPRRLDGGEGPEAESARELAAAVAAASGLAVELWDERLTSRMAERALAPAGSSAARQRRRRQAVDQVAAAILLQSFLDRPGGGSASTRAGR